LHSSEIISISWAVFFLIFAVVACLYADRDQNKDRIEWMKAVLFANVVFISIFGALTPEFIAYVLGIPWRTNSSLNTIGTVVGMMTSWAVMQWAVDWMAWLAALVATLGAITWVVVQFII